MQISNVFFSDPIAESSSDQLISRFVLYFIWNSFKRSFKKSHADCRGAYKYRMHINYRFCHFLDSPPVSWNSTETLEWLHRILRKLKLPMPVPPAAADGKSKWNNMIYDIFKLKILNTVNYYWCSIIFRNLAIWVHVLSILLQHVAATRTFEKVPFCIDQSVSKPSG